MTILLHWYHYLDSGELEGGRGKLPSMNSILFLADKDTIILFLQPLKPEPEKGTVTRDMPRILEEWRNNGLEGLGTNLEGSRLLELIPVSESEGAITKNQISSKYENVEKIQKYHSFYNRKGTTLTISTNQKRQRILAFKIWTNPQKMSEP